MKFKVFIEIPKYSKQKFEFDEELQKIKLDRVLYGPMYFPFEYGSILGTKGEDNDPLDCVLISSFPSFPGCLVEAEAIGVLMMEDEAGIDHKIIAKPIEKVDPRYKQITDINDLTDHYKIEIKEFFENYKNLEPDKWVKLKGFEDKKSAEKIIDQAFKREQK
jgi:inorganic pyrophosphatase